jgi:hypothetical protein
MITKKVARQRRGGHSIKAVEIELRRPTKRSR